MFSKYLHGCAYPNRFELGLLYLERLLLHYNVI